MIAVSLLLIVGAAGLLGLGLWQSSSALLSGSIAASLLAAIVLVVGVRRSAAPRSSGGDHEPEPEHDPEPEPDPARTGEAVTMSIPVQGAGRGGAREPAGHQAAAHQPAGPQNVGHQAVGQQAASQPGGHEPEDYPEDEDPPDEPAPQQVSAADAARVGRMITEVLVVDGRPRYHLPGCVHLLGRESEPLPVGEAVELGFTPCSLCEPDSALLADARRV